MTFIFERKMLTDNTMKNDIKQAASRRNIAAAMLAAILCVASTGCRKQSLESTYSSQEERIDSYITSQMESNEDYELVHNNGSNRIIIQAGSGNALAPGGTVSFYYAGYMFSGSISASNMFATNWQAVAEESGWSLTDADYSVKTVRLTEDELIDGLLYGLEGVRAGEECLILFSGKYGFGNRQVGTIPANSALAYHIRVESVSE